MPRKAEDSITTASKPFSASSKAGAHIPGRRRTPFDFKKGGSGIIKLAIVAILIKIGLKKL